MTTRKFHLLSLALLFLVSASFAASSDDVSGKWKWTIERNVETQDITMTAKQEGGKVTGKIAGPEGREIEIQNGRLSDENTLTFFINLERNGNTMKIDFHGKVQGDKIDGKTEYTNRDGERRDFDWNARRDAKKAGDLSGKWKSSMKRQDGNSMESTLTLKQQGDKLTGSNEFNGNEREIRDGKIQGEDIAFKTMGERDGRTVTTKYHGKVQKDGSIKGTIESDWTGEVRKMEWEARKE
jgi:hypothetical protein